MGKQITHGVCRAAGPRHPLIVLTALLGTFAGVGAGPPQIDPMLAEVLGNIGRQPIGSHTVADLNYPEEYFQRIAQRVLRASFEDTFRIVIPGAVPAATTRTPGAPPPANPHTDILAAATSRPYYGVSVFNPRTPRFMQRYRALREERPALRGFRALPIDTPPIDWPTDLAANASHAEVCAAELVGRRLAFDGLLYTLAQVIDVLGPERFLSIDVEKDYTLRDVGLPTDLLRYFHWPTASSDASALVQQLALRLVCGSTPAALRAELDGIQFQFSPRMKGFQIATESGEAELNTVWGQLTRPWYFEGEGDGSSVDILRQLVTALPNTEFFVGVEKSHAEQFRALATGGWPFPRDRQVRAVTSDLIVSQWAGDNSKGGLAPTGPDKAAVATIAPRYASRGEDGSVFVPGESYMMWGKAMVAPRWMLHSPLLFQGGDLLPVRDPRTGQRILLIGEGEIYRNTSLGLTRAQVLDAFRIEFGVDRCEVLPAVSFHIDYELTVRAINGRLVAFVNDTEAAVPIVLECGIAALERSKSVSAEQARAALKHLHAKEYPEFLSLFGPLLRAKAVRAGQYSESFAHVFSTSPVDSGVGNLQRVLLALDLLRSQRTADADADLDAPTRTYINSLRNRAADRRALHARLRELGFEVVGIPSLSDGNRSINYVNCIQTSAHVVMPAYGGLFAPLDEIAAAAIRAKLGPDVDVVKIACAESQRRGGALHCSMLVYPHADGTANGR